MAAAGSVWNKNSWHWEEKDYTKYAVDRLKFHLDGVAVGQDSVKLSNVTAKGTASLNVRKGKRIVALDLNICAEWRTDTGQRGSLKIDGVDVDSAKENDYEINVTASASDEAHRRIKDALRKADAAKDIQRLLRNFVKDLESAETDAAAAEADKQRREMELEKMKAAVDLKGEEQRHLLEEAKSLDNQKRERALKAVDQEARQNADCVDASIEAPKCAPTVAKAEGSVWNVNSYHWEEKNMSKWGAESLQSILCEPFKITFTEDDKAYAATHIDVSFCHPTVAGEASTSIRKGRKVVFFEFLVNASWTAVLRESKTKKFYADANGGLSILEFSSECAADECDIKLQATTDAEHPSRQKINSMMERDGKKAIRAKLQRFCELLQSRD